MLGNQSDVFNLNKKEQKEIKNKKNFIQSTPIKLCFVIIVNVFLLIPYCLHLFTCDNKDQYCFLNSDISAYDFHIENGIVEEMMALTFF